MHVLLPEQGPPVIAIRHIGCFGNSSGWRGPEDAVAVGSAALFHGELGLCAVLLPWAKELASLLIHMSLVW